MKIKITHDVFNICNRIKAHNKNYYIMYNTNTNKFELHNKSFQPTLCSVLPYKQLDIRTINYIFKNENPEKVIETLEKNNEKINKHNKEKINDLASYQFNEIYKYSKNSCKEFIGNAFINKWI